jgi:hypothetical protein
VALGHEEPDGQSQISQGRVPEKHRDRENVESGGNMTNAQSRERTMTGIGSPVEKVSNMAL